MGDSYKTYLKQKQKERRAEARRRTGGPLLHSIAAFAGVIFIAGCTLSIASTQIEIAEKKQQLAELQERKKELEIQYNEYAGILSEDDERVYMERIAIDVLGYAYPNERRFYDTTRN